MRYDLEYNHLGLVPRCGACADTIFRHERVVALFGHDNSASCRGQTRPSPFPPQPGYPQTNIDGYWPCRYPACGRCALSPECVPIHYDCLVIFIRECPLAEPKALDRLWTVGCYRNPWSKTPLLHLEPDRRFVDQEVLRKMAYICGLPQLYSLPPELGELIRQRTPHAMFWRAISTVSLAGRIVPSQPLLELPLRDVQSWGRGGPVVHISGPRRPVIRLVVDAEGICKIERLPTRPIYRRDGTANSHAYIVETEEALSGVGVHLKDGLLRLCLPPSLPTLRIWDTPAPPELNGCFFSHRPTNASWQRFRTIDLGTITGITFFYSVRRLIAVHAHNSPESCALSTYDRLSNRRQKGTLWIYLPIARQDKVVAVGVRNGEGRLSDILIRTRLAGDIIVGSRFESAKGDRWLGGSSSSSSKERITLIYGEPRDSEGVPFIGGYCPTWLPLTRPLTVPQDRTEPKDDYDMHFSSAPLSMVSCASVLYDEENGFCRGILFEYENGGLRTVGQCRLHVDPSKKYTRPSGFCFRASSCLTRDWRQEVEGTHVEFGTGHSRCEHLADDGWQCQTLSGTLKFWYSPRRSLLSVE